MKIYDFNFSIYPISRGFFSLGKKRALQLINLKIEFIKALILNGKLPFFSALLTKPSFYLLSL